MAEGEGGHSMDFDHFEQELKGVEELLTRHQPDANALSRARRQQIIRDLNERRGLTLESNFAMRRATATFSPESAANIPLYPPDGGGHGRGGVPDAWSGDAASKPTAGPPSSPGARAYRQAVRESSSSEHGAPSSRVSSSNRYKSREEREQLVQRLLREREERLHAKIAAASPPRPSEKARSPKRSPARTRSSPPPPPPATAGAARSPAGPEEYNAEKHSLGGELSSGLGGGGGGGGSGGEGGPASGSPHRSHSPPRGQRPEEQQHQKTQSQRGPQQRGARPARGARAASASRARPASAVGGRADGASRGGGGRIGLRTNAQSSVRRSRDDLALERERQEMAECTFQPRTNRGAGRAAGVPAATRARRGARGGRTGAPRLEALAQSRRELFEQRERERVLAARQRELEECTFKPRLVARRGAARGRGGGRGGGHGGRRESVQERLHAEAKERELARARAAEEARRAELAGHNFRPSINAGSEAWLDKDRYKPIHERVGELQREKQFRLQQRRMEAELENRDLTFAPRINARSSAMASGRSEEGAEGDDGGDAWNGGSERGDIGARPSAAERLAEDAARRMERQLQKQRQYAEEMERDCRFEPAINQRSRQIAGSLPHFQGAGRGFVERQELLRESTGEKLRQRSLRMQAEEREAVCTFAPAIGNADEVLAQAKPGRLHETAEERCERMSRKDREMAERRRQAAAAMDASRFSFEPRINERSKRMAPKSSLEDLVRARRCHRRPAPASRAPLPPSQVNDTRRKRAQLRATSMAEEDFRRSHTFRPSLVTGARRPVEDGEDGEMAEGGRFRVDFSNADTITDRIQQHHAQQEAKREWARRMAEYEELQGCTFAPQISTAPPKQSGPVVVRGLGRYLELREMARQREDDERVRAENAFRVRGSASYRDAKGHTRAQPFSLQTEARAALSARRSTAVDELAAKEMGECTFHPKTMEGVNRKAIREILDD